VDVGAVLFDILVLLLAAKIGAEVAERVGAPPVVGEIVAGVLIGPSVLGLVSGGEIIEVLAELGVILLLLQVGMEMDLKELGAVGRAAMSVAVAGVALPFIGGWAVGMAFGQDMNTALFIGAALTATSVGITARVFGDLRALATVEARTVLGAAVADDVLGLVILTVMVKIVTTGSVSPLGVGEIFGVAVAFLVLSVAVGVLIAPPLFNWIQRFSRSTGTLLALAFAFTLVFAELASKADLAPIIGAFVAGLALGRTKQHERLERDLAPLGHVFIPVFFLQIGIETDIAAFIRPEVLGLAAALLVVATAGKILAGWAAGRAGGDRFLIGLGMLPRGEVGLIFAGIGLAEGVLDDDLYAAILIVVITTTLVAPFLLRARRLSTQRARGEIGGGTAEMPDDGWPVLEDGEIELRVDPPSSAALHVALQAAAIAAQARPGNSLLRWFGDLPDEPLRWDAEATGELFSVLRHGNARSWRFLEATGVLDQSLPELAEAVGRRRRDPMNLDPGGALRWTTVERLHEQALDPATAGEHGRLVHEEWLVLAGLILDITGGGPDAAETALALVRRLELGPDAEAEITLLVAESDLMEAAVRRPDRFSENAVLQLAAHLDTPERARALYLLTKAVADNDHDEQTLDAVHELIQAALASDDLAMATHSDLVDERRLEAKALAQPSAAARIDHAPRPYLLGTPAEVVADHAELAGALTWSDKVRVKVAGDPRQWHWRIDIAARDVEGLLASVTDAMRAEGLEVISAQLATWGDGVAIQSFRVRTDHVPSVGALDAAITTRLGAPFQSVPVLDATVTFDRLSSPWYTRAEVESPDARGLLHTLAVAFAASGAKVHSAEISTTKGAAFDIFELTDRRGEKLSPEDESRVVAAVRGGSRIPSRRLRDGARKALTLRKHSGDRQETPVP
jgi:Kef-type K+ transport system membrane component KefB